MTSKKYLLLHPGFPCTFNKFQTTNLNNHEYEYEYEVV